MCLAKSLNSFDFENFKGYNDTASMCSFLAQGNRIEYVLIECKENIF